MLDGLGEVLRKDNNNLDLHCHVARGLANFARFQQNASKIVTKVPTLPYSVYYSNFAKQS